MGAAGFVKIAKLVEISSFAIHNLILSKSGFPHDFK